MLSLAPRNRSEMCRSSNITGKKNGTKSNSAESGAAAKQNADEMGLQKDSSDSNGRQRPVSETTCTSLTRRCKRDKQIEWSKQLSTLSATASPASKRIVKKKKMSRMTAKHQNDSKSGGIDALLPSLIGVVILVIAIMARMGFRGRATVAGIDLGTTNSVICVQAQEKSGELIYINNHL